MEEIDVFSLTTQAAFQGYVESLESKEDALSETAFAAVYLVEDDPFRQQQRTEALREHAKELGIPAKTFEEHRKAFHRGLEQFRRKGKQEREATDSPAWLFQGRVIEADFCDAFRQKYGDMACWGGVFYDENGVVERDKLLQRITQELSPYVTTRLAQKAKDLLAALRSFCYQEAPQADPTRIHVKGGYITLDGVFHADRYITQNRLDVEYDPAAQPPAVFLDYVNALLEPEDVLTLQEFLGYCCIPTTKAQKMLFLIGSGGEGKSVLTQVLKGVFGTSMTSGSLHDLERNRFTLANLEGKLLFLDEDMGVSATKESQVQKRLVTANAPLSIERKGEQAVQAMLTCRLMAFGNVPFSTLYDHSEGAFRRRIILTTKPKQEGRRDDRDLPDKILQGKSGVFNWMLEGLSRLTSNGWEFTISQRARENLEETKRESFNLLGFLADENAVRLGDLSRKNHRRGLVRRLHSLVLCQRGKAREPEKRDLLLKAGTAAAGHPGQQPCAGQPGRESPGIRGN